MKNTKRIVTSAGLVTCIVVGIVMTIRHAHRSIPEPPSGLMEKTQERIDAETLELMTLTLGEWDKLRGKHHRFKNPKTGKYTMVAPMECRSCGEKIPIPLYPEDVLKDARSIEAYERQYRCPKCGNSPY